MFLVPREHGKERAKGATGDLSSPGSITIHFIVLGILTTFRFTSHLRPRNQAFLIR